MFGLYAERPALPGVEVFYLWPENVEAWDLFLACGTQWRINDGGREGLDYSGVEIVMARRRIDPALHDQRFNEVQAMELSALTAWAKK